MSTIKAKQIRVNSKEHKKDIERFITAAKLIDRNFGSFKIDKQLLDKVKMYPNTAKHTADEFEILVRQARMKSIQRRNIIQ